MIGLIDCWFHINSYIVIFIIDCAADNLRYENDVYHNKLIKLVF